MKKAIVTIYCLILLAALAICTYAYAVTGETGDMTWEERIIEVETI